MQRKNKRIKENENFNIDNLNDILKYLILTISHIDIVLLNDNTLTKQHNNGITNNTI